MKRIISFLLATFVFIFNCIPIFAAEFVSGNFNIVPDGFLEDINLTIQEGHKYIYYFQAKNNSWEGPNHHIIYFDFPLDVEGVISETRITLTNSENTDSVIYWTRSLSGLDGQFYSGKTMAVGESFTIGVGLVVVPELLIYNGDCVSKNYCSEDIYVEMGSDEDYIEDGVTIKGLTGFFNKVSSQIKEGVETIKNMPELLITGFFDMLKNLFIPNTYNMEIVFSSFIDYLTNKMGYNSLIETLKSMIESVPEVSSNAADIYTEFNFKVDKTFVPLKLSIPFSVLLTDDIKNTFAGYLKGFFFFLLVFYNLSEIYFLIRGVRPWKDPQITMLHNEIERDNLNSYIAHKKGGGYGI